MKKIIYFFGTLFIVALNLNGQQFFKDLIPGTSWSDPMHFTECNGKLFFFARDISGNSGNELWVSDGTPGGTNLVLEIDANKGAIDFDSPLISMPPYVYFIAQQGSLQKQIWRSDGSAAGTIGLTSQTEIGPPENLTVCNGLLFFSFETLADGRRLWKTDGTVSGTSKVQPLVNASPKIADNSSNVKMFEDVNGLLYFEAKDFALNHAIYRSDGTTNGTYSVAAIPLISGSIKYPKTINNSLFFVMNGGVEGEELHKLDLNNNQISLVKDIFDDNNPNGLVGSYPDNLMEFQGKLHFTAITSASGRELWSSDGTESGTNQIMDINPGIDDISSGGNFYLIGGGGSLWFTATGATNGQELWKSGGGAVSTTMVRDINTGGIGSAPEDLYYDNGVLYLSAYSDNIQNGDRKFYVSDGSNFGTRMLGDNDNGLVYKSPTSFFEFNGKIFFGAEDNIHGRELWTLDILTLAIGQHAPNKSGIKIYPNPVSHNMYFAIDKKYNGLLNVSVSDQLGRMVLQTTTDGKQALDCSSIAPGVYIAEVSYDGFHEYFRFVKEY